MKIFKKLGIGLLAFSLVGCGAPDIVESEDTATSDDIEESTSYSGEITMEMLLTTEPASENDFESFNDYENMECTIVTYLGDAEILVIPEEIDGCKVIAINKYTFANDSSVKAISLPDTVEELETGVFGSNSNLELVDLGDGLKTIGEGAFFGCENLTSLILPDGLETISSKGICNTGIMTIEIPASVTYIGSTGVYNIDGLDLIIGESGSTAEEYALEYGIEFQVKE